MPPGELYMKGETDIKLFSTAQRMFLSGGTEKILDIAKWGYVGDK